MSGMFAFMQSSSPLMQGSDIGYALMLRLWTPAWMKLLIASFIFDSIQYFVRGFEVEDHFPVVSDLLSSVMLTSPSHKDFSVAMRLNLTEM